jgi:hypothetical protein
MGVCVFVSCGAEFGQKGETLELPPNCKLEFPDAPLDRNEVTSGKYKRFIVHYTPDEGVSSG